MKILFNNYLIKDKDLVREINEWLEIIRKIIKQKNYEDDLSFVCLPEDENNLQELEKLKDYTKINNLFFIGIGGSHLPLLGFNYFFASKINKKVYFLEGIEEEEIQNNLKKLEEVIDKKDFLIIIVSKSGKTIESLINFYFVFNLVKKKIKNGWQNHFIILTDKDSPLDKFAFENNLQKFVFPPLKVGRFLVFSQLGLIFLYLVGLEVKEFLRGGKEINEILLTEEVENNFIIKSAFWIYENFLNKRRLYNLFTFSNRLSGLSLWYRQLIAESLGKEDKGIIPFYFLAPRDLHSVYQLLRDGYQEHFSSFIYLKTPSELNIKDQFIFDLNLKDKSLEEINWIIYKAVKNDFEKLNYPFMEISIEEESERELGKFMEYKMLEIVLLGKMLKVNPFDQPGVENYKNNIRKFLSY